MQAPLVADKSVLANAATPETDTYYSGAYQWVVSPGSSASFTQHLPWLMPADYHTLAEMAVEPADLRQIVEVGWLVDRIEKSNSSTGKSEGPVIDFTSNFERYSHCYSRQVRC